MNEPLNPELVMYRLEEMNTLLKTHNEKHEKQLEQIYDLFDGLGKKYSGKWVEKSVWWVASAILGAFILAVIGLVFAKPVVTGIGYIVHKFI